MSTTAIVTAQSATLSPITNIEPRTMSELEALAEHVAESKFFGITNKSQAIVILMLGRDLGMSYTQAARAFQIQNGKPTLSAAGMVAVCLSSDLCEYFEVIEATDTSATVCTKRKGREEKRETFTIDQARKAGLLGKDVWQKYPSRMLIAAAQRSLARHVYADILFGLYDEDEVPAPPSPPRRVEVQATVVPEARATPRSAHQEPDWVAILDACTHLDELTDIARQMKTMGVTRNGHPQAAEAYVRAKARCERVASAAQEQPAAVEAEVINEDSEP